MEEGALSPTVGDASVRRSSAGVKVVLASAVLEDGPAAAEMLGLVRGVLGVAKVDQVEVDVPDIGPAQVGAAEVGLADLLDGPDVLVVVIVGVELGAAPLAGD